MDNPYDVPKVTLYRTLVGMMGALWLIEWGLTGRIGQQRFRVPSLDGARRWLVGPPARWVLMAVCVVMASNLISTLLSPSMSVSFWGREPAFDGYGFYNTLSHFVLFAVVASHLKSTAQLWRL
jgi:hypothetical protein